VVKRVMPMAGNDNKRPVPLTKVEVDVECARIASRCLALLVAPDEPMVWKVAWDRWHIAEFVMNEIFANEQSTVEQTVVALQVLASWQQYWGRFHRKESERGRCLVAWMNTRAVLKEHKEQGNVGI
jgi:hypothetical protein